MSYQLRLPATYRRLFFLMILPLLVPAGLAAQWTSAKPAELSNNMYGIYMATDRTGYAVGWGATGSTIAKTIDGGSTWTTDDLPGALLFDAAFTNAGVGVVSGYSADCQCGLLLRTIDGGHEWMGATFSGSFGFYDLAMPGGDVMYVGGYGGVILKSIDLGQGWVQLNTGITDVVRRLAFPTPIVGYAVAGYGNNFQQPGQILKTVDGGDSWTQIQDYSETRSIADIHFTSPDVGFYVGSDGTACIYKTTDGGITWTRKYSGKQTHVLQAISFRDAMNGLAVGDSGNILITTDGGESWMNEGLPLTYSLLSVAYSAGGTAIAAGMNGMIVRRTGTQSGVDINRYSSHAGRITPNPVHTDATVLLDGIDQGEQYSFFLYDILGRESLRIDGTRETGALHIVRGDLPPGIYMYKLTAKNGSVGSGPVFIR